MTTCAEEEDRNFSVSAFFGPGMSIILAALGTSAAAVILPELSNEFRDSNLDASMVVSIYILAATALIVPIGRVGDLLGKRKVLVIGLCIFTLGAAFASYASTLPVLIASRLVQGAGAAAMMAMPLAQIRDFVPTGHVGRWMGMMGTLSAIGTASGPALGGAITATFGWRAVFLVQALFAVVALATCMMWIKDDQRAVVRSPIGFAGAGALVLSFTTFAFAFSNINGGFSSFSAILLAVALLAFAGFWIFESYAATPTIPLDLLRSTQLRLSLTMNVIVSLVMMGVLVVGPFFLTCGLGLTTAQMGLAMSVGPIASAVSGVPAGWLTEWIGAGHAVLLGGMAVTIATAAMAGLPYLFGLSGFLVAFMLLSPSYQIFLAALNTSVMENASEPDRGVTSGVLNLSRNFGFILGASVISAIFWALVHVDSNLDDEARNTSLAMAGTFAICCVLASGVVLLAITSRRDRFKCHGPNESQHVRQGGN